MRIDAARIHRVVCTPDGVVREPGMNIVSEEAYPQTVRTPGTEGEPLEFSGENGILLTQTGYRFLPREIHTYSIEGGKAKIVTRKTIDGERSFVENASVRKTGDAWTASVTFAIGDEECIYGLGQHENGTYNYRDVKEYLYQNNMQIPMPVFLSSKGYGILFDAGCLMTYEEKDNVITVTLDAVDQIAYYVISGENFDELIRGIRVLTGKAVMLPKWAFGYVQSKERYVSQEDILHTEEEFKKRDIPLSCLVLDWKSWEEGKWGNKYVDKSRFPNLREMTDALHEDGVAFMISLWPNMNKGCENNQEMLEAGKLLANLSTYDAFDPEARDLYWDQCRRELYRDGTDAWWCDSTEPFTPDWNGPTKRPDEERYELAKENLTRYFDARKANNYALVHAQGMYEHQRKEPVQKRVLNLTRSGSLSIQRYGVVLWSGDIMATWDVFKKQIAEGLSMCMSGIPYWTLDIGAFFAGSTQGFRRFSNVTEGEAPWFWHGDFEDGCRDLGYRELYTRWLQFGAFLPMMRSHGTDTPREPWNFGEPGTVYYDTIVKYIRMRYEMLPYSYSLARQVEENGYTILRSLMFDFASDEKVRTMSGEFMYGPAFLVCPVTEPLGYGPGSRKLSKEETWDVYLPQGSGWYRQDTKEWLEGGQTAKLDAPISWQPVLIREGSIVPMDKGIRKDGSFDTVEVYAGCDGSFTWYQDNGLDYAYENGEYAKIPMEWKDGESVLILGAAEGSYAYPETILCRCFRRDGSVCEKEVRYTGKETRVTLE